jgi:hypothetical protein
MHGAAVAIVILLTACVACAAPPRPPLTEIDAAFAARIEPLAMRAAAAGHAGLAAAIRGWQLPPDDGRQLAVAIPPRLEMPAGLVAAAAPDAPAATAIWNDFVAARRRHAVETFAHVAAAAPCAATRLIQRVLRDDPEHEQARAAAGWVGSKEGWVWPQARRHRDRGDEWDARFGWLPRGRLARYRNGERYHRGRWITATADDGLVLTLKDGRRFVSDHWEITSTAPLAAAAALAADLEEAHAVWGQVFGPLAVAPRGRRSPGRGPVVQAEPFVALLCRDRQGYLAEFEPLEPAIGMTQGAYWAPTRTLWLVATATADDAATSRATVRHEATHQLCAESRPTSPLAGERCGFWAIEAAACYMESIRPEPFGWSVGGREAGRVPAARALLIEDGFFVPLAELTPLGRGEFQDDRRIARIYTQLAGLADFFMNGLDGRYREAFVSYLVRIYDGTADPDTLARLCDTDYADLDAAYRRHLSR